MVAGAARPYWPRILLRSLALCLVGLGALYAISIATQLHLLRGGPRLVANVAAAVFLAAVPWALSWPLHRWRREVERRGCARRGSASRRSGASTMTIRRAAGRAGWAACGAALVVAVEVAVYRRAVVRLAERLLG